MEKKTSSRRLIIISVVGLVLLIVAINIALYRNLML